MHHKYLVNNMYVTGYYIKPIQSCGHIWKIQPRVTHREPWSNPGIAPRNRPSKASFGGEQAHIRVTITPHCYTGEHAAMQQFLEKIDPENRCVTV